MSSPLVSITYDLLTLEIATATARSLDRIVPKIYRAVLEGRISEEEMELLQKAADCRDAVFKARQRVGQKFSSKLKIGKDQIAKEPNDRSGRFRKWRGSGALPPSLRIHFTPGEMAVAAVIRDEVRRKGICALSWAQIANKCGLASTTTVKNFVRKARLRQMIEVQEREQKHARNLTNVVTITSNDWRTWCRLEEAKTGGTKMPPYESNFKSRRVAKQKGETAARAQKTSALAEGFGDREAGRPEAKNEVDDISDREGRRTSSALEGVQRGNKAPNRFPKDRDDRWQPLSVASELLNQAQASSSDRKGNQSEISDPSEKPNGDEGGVADHSPLLFGVGLSCDER